MLVCDDDAADVTETERGRVMRCDGMQFLLFSLREKVIAVLRFGFLFRVKRWELQLTCTVILGSEDQGPTVKS